MRGTSNKVIQELQNINHSMVILMDLCKEEPTKVILAQIRRNALNIKTITNKYTEVV
ncbi:hypothetical protein [Clostridium sp.]